MPPLNSLSGSDLSLLPTLRSEGAPPSTAPAERQLPLTSSTAPAERHLPLTSSAAPAERHPNTPPKNSDQTPNYIFRHSSSDAPYSIDNFLSCF